MIQEAELLHGDPITVIVSRRNILRTVISATKKNFSFMSPINVVFAGEEGDNAGGPKRELMR